MAASDIKGAYISLRIAMLSIHSSPIGPLGTLNTGGMSVYVRELSKWLGAAGHYIDIYTCASGPSCEVDLYPGVRLIHLDRGNHSEIDKEHLPNHLKEAFEALERYRKSQGLTYDLVHSHYWLSGVIGAMAQSHWQCPHLTMFHTLGVLKNKTDSEENEPSHRIANERKLVNSADGIVVPARKEYENLLLDYYAQPYKLSIIPCGVNLELFRPMDQTAARTAIGQASNKPLALYVGRFAPLKGLDLLLSAVAHLKDKGTDLHLMIVGGDGPRSANTTVLIELTNRLGIRSQVTFVGRIEQRDLPTYYSAADLLVVPSHYESFGLVVLEALACGTPVAATQFGVAESVIQNDVNGVIIAGPEVTPVAKAMLGQLSRSGQDRLSRSQIRETVAGYGWRRIATDVAKVYNQLIEDHTNSPQTVPTAKVCGCSN
jgi:D-inositol-3-phosphate glycosyltransferase